VFIVSSLWCANVNRVYASIAWI